MRFKAQKGRWVWRGSNDLAVVIVEKLYMV